MEKISLGKFQPLKAPLTKRWEVATSNEKENCLKTAEISCRLLCSGNGKRETEFTRHTYVNNSIQECTNKESKNSNSRLYVLNYLTEELKKLHEPFEKLSDR